MEKNKSKIEIPENWVAKDLKYLPIEDLIPHARNSRVHTQTQIKKLQASMREWGWTVPVIVDENNSIIAGHGRVLAAEAEKIENIPCLVASGWSDAKKRAYVIADNKLTDVSHFDLSIVSDEMRELEDMGFDLSLTGFDQEEIEDLLNDDENPEDGLTDEDEIPAEPIVPTTILGDVWLLGDHRLMCGDSMGEKTVAKLIGKPAGKVHCITDPPYGIAYDPKAQHKYGMIKNDDVFLDFISLAAKFTDGFFFMWTSYQVVHEWINRVNAEFTKITNLIACHTLGRKMLGMELDPVYCDVVIRRWQDFTGNEAIHAESGKTYNELGGGYVERQEEKTN